ncbi:hypothetical protein Bbelb_109130 [Branchiostoma belcheri]|nr:hypothetical protein Bbelb_109130 [Branchiostoma belcheri]
MSPHRAAPSFLRAGTFPVLGGIRAHPPAHASAPPTPAAACIAKFSSQDDAIVEDARLFGSGKGWRRNSEPLPLPWEDECEVMSVPSSRNPISFPYTPHGHPLHDKGMLRRCLRIISTAAKERAYMALVRPTLEYGCSVWDPHNRDQAIASKSNYYRISFFPRTIREWNELEPGVAEAESLAQFKTELARTLLHCATPHFRTTLPSVTGVVPPLFAIAPQGVNILDTERDYFARGVKEAIYIRAHQPSLNRDGGRYRLPTNFDPVLTSHVGKTTCSQRSGH